MVSPVSVLWDVAGDAADGKAHPARYAAKYPNCPNWEIM
jgi:hypothetical protein